MDVVERLEDKMRDNNEFAVLAVAVGVGCGVGSRPRTELVSSVGSRFARLDIADEAASRFDRGVGAIATRSLRGDTGMVGLCALLCWRLRCDATRFFDR